MRVIVTMRGAAVLDLELCWPGRQGSGEEPPALQAAGHLAASEIAEPMEAPDCSAFGFGRRPESVAKGPGQAFRSNCPRPRTQAAPPAAPPR